MNDQVSAPKKTDRELLVELYEACLNLTRCLGDKKGYLPQVGFPSTKRIVDAVRRTRKHLGRRDSVFNKMDERYVNDTESVETSY